MKLTDYGVNFGECGIPLDDLLNQGKLLEIVKQYAVYLETESMAISASLFFKRYAVLTAAAALDYYGLQNGRQNWFQHARFDAVRFTLNIQETEVQIDEDWRKVLFKDHLLPMCHILSKECKMPSKILWENVAVRLNAVLKRSVGHYSEEALQKQFEELSAIHPTWLVDQTNPLAQYMSPPNKEYVRKTCCRYYQLTKKEDGMPYCLVCPLK